MARSKADPVAVEDLKRVTSFDDAVIQDLAEAGSVVNIPERWSVMAEQTPADTAYILLDGTVEVRKHKELVATLEPGALFGEVALVQLSLRSASVFAATPIKALRIDQESLHRIIDAHESFAEALRKTAEERAGS